MLHHTQSILTSTGHTLGVPSLRSFGRTPSLHPPPPQHTHNSLHSDIEAPVKMLSNFFSFIDKVQPLSRGGEGRGGKWEERGEGRGGRGEREGRGGEGKGGKGKWFLFQKMITTAQKYQFLTALSFPPHPPSPFSTPPLHITHLPCQRTSSVPSLGHPCSRPPSPHQHRWTGWSCLPCQNRNLGMETQNREVNMYRYR